MSVVGEGVTVGIGVGTAIGVGKGVTIGVGEGVGVGASGWAQAANSKIVNAQLYNQ